MIKVFLFLEPYERSSEFMGLCHIFACITETNTFDESQPKFMSVLNCLNN